LARLRSDNQSKIVWTMLTQQDFMHAGAQEEDLDDVIEELIVSSPEAKVIVLLFENRERNICATVHAERPLNASQLCARFKPTGTHQEVQIRFKNKTLPQVEKEIIEHLKKELEKKHPMR